MQMVGAASKGLFWNPTFSCCGAARAGPEEHRERISGHEAVRTSEAIRAKLSSCWDLFSLRCLKLNTSQLRLTPDLFAL